LRSGWPAEFFNDTRETFDVFRFEYDELKDLDDRVLAIGTLRVPGDPAKALTAAGLGQ
jgi:hypothetical protein